MGDGSAWAKEVEAMGFWDRFRLGKDGFFFTLFSRNFKATGYDVPESKIQADNLAIERRRQARIEAENRNKGGSENVR